MLSYLLRDFVVMEKRKNIENSLTREKRVILNEWRLEKWRIEPMFLLKTY